MKTHFRGAPPPLQPLTVDFHENTVHFLSFTVHSR